MFDKLMAKVYAFFAVWFVLTLVIFIIIRIIEMIWWELLIGGAIITIGIVVWRILHARYRRW